MGNHSSNCKGHSEKTDCHSTRDRRKKKKKPGSILAKMRVTITDTYRRDTCTCNLKKRSPKKIEIESESSEYDAFDSDTSMGDTDLYDGCVLSDNDIAETWRGPKHRVEPNHGVKQSSYKIKDIPCQKLSGRFTKVVERTSGQEVHVSMETTDEHPYSDFMSCWRTSQGDFDSGYDSVSFNNYRSKLLPDSGVNTFRKPDKSIVSENLILHVHTGSQYLEEQNENDLEHTHIFDRLINAFITSQDQVRDQGYEAIDSETVSQDTEVSGSDTVPGHMTTEDSNNFRTLTVGSFDDTNYTSMKYLHIHDSQFPVETEPVDVSFASEFDDYQYVHKVPSWKNGTFDLPIVEDSVTDDVTHYPHTSASELRWHAADSTHTSELSDTFQKSDYSNEWNYPSSHTDSLIHDNSARICDSQTLGTGITTDTVTETSLDSENTSHTGNDQSEIETLHVMDNQIPDNCTITNNIKTLLASQLAEYFGSPATDSLRHLKSLSSPTTVTSVMDTKVTDNGKCTFLGKIDTAFADTYAGDDSVVQGNMHRMKYPAANKLHSSKRTCDKRENKSLFGELNSSEVDSGIYSTIESLNQKFASLEKQQTHLQKKLSRTRNRKIFRHTRNRLQVITKLTKGIARHWYQPGQNTVQQHVVNPATGLDSYFERLRSGEPVSLQEQMRYQWMRLNSFVRYNGNGNAIRLARSGFYLNSSGNAHETVCFACGFRYSTWQFSDKIDEIHRRLSPTCPIVNGNNAGNVPIEHADMSEGSQMEPTQTTAATESVEVSATVPGYTSMENPPVIPIMASSETPAPHMSSTTSIIATATTSTRQDEAENGPFASLSNIQGSSIQPTSSPTSAQTSTYNVPMSHTSAPSQPIEDAENQHYAILLDSHPGWSLVPSTAAANVAMMTSGASLRIREQNTSIHTICTNEEPGFHFL